MKKIVLGLLTIVLLSISLVCFAACGDASEEEDTRPELTLTTNIKGAGTVYGGGHFDYNDDLYIKAEAKSGYYFLGWYFDNDLISTSAEYNCKMWNKDVTLEAKFTALPKDYNGNGSSGNFGDIVNTNFKLLVKTDTPLLGKVNVNDAGNRDEYIITEKSGNNIKVLALTNSSKRFLGWYDDSDNLVMANGVFEFAMPSFDYTLHARWQCDEEKLIYDSSTKKYICSVCGGFGVSNEKFAIIDDSEKGKTLVAYFGNDENVTIPSNVNAIAENAFVDATQIKSVVIPSSVTSIACGAFYGCSSLERITLPLVDDNVNDGSTYPFGHIFGTKSYGGVSSVKQFYKHNEGTNTNYYYIPSSLKSVTINGGNICDYAFYNCTGLTSVTIGNGVTSIGDYAFYNCQSLANVTIGNSVTSIGYDAFYKCTGLRSVTIPDSVTSIGELAFGNCTGLTSVTIPDSVTSIGSSAFYNCTGLTSVTIGNSVTSIGSYAFGNCTGLTSVTIPDSVTSIGSSAFDNCTGLTSVTIGNSVTSIGEDAFHGCTGLTSVTIPDSVTSIGDHAFDDCDSLKSVTIGNSVTSIGNYAFENCYKLVEVINHSSLNIEAGSSSNGYVGYYAIEVHTGESKIVNYNDYLFYAYNGVNYLFGYVGKDTALVLPESYNGENYKIYQYAFYGRNDIISVVIPDSVTSIGSSAFRGCTGLTSITIPDSVTSIGDKAFYVCTCLESVTIGNGVTSIGKSAFKGCDGLTSVTFENPNGWRYSSSSLAIGGTSISASSLSSTSTAATYLNSKYDDEYWKRS